MSEENALTAPPSGGTLLAQHGIETAVDRKAFDQLVESKFLPRIQLMTSRSGKCEKGEFPANHYALIRGQDYKDLGASVNVLVIAWRAKAMDTGGDEIISVFDQEHSEFIRIKSKSAEKDSGCMFGIEFLLWVPEDDQFVTFFMASISARNEAPLLLERLGGMATISTQVLENKKYTWNSPKVSKCSVNPELTPELLERLAQVKADFENPPAIDAEVASEDEQSATDRER